MGKSPSITRKKTEVGPVSAREGLAEMRRGDAPDRTPPPDTPASKPAASSEESFGDRYPLTDEQRAALSHDISNLKRTLQAITTLMKACFGEDSQVAVRAEECSAAVQRFDWELERMARGSPAIPDGRKKSSGK
jgi:hypothetical protein